jgi:N-acetylglucosamine kinase-like BadF-type ATPase
VDQPYRIGVDGGGTKTECILIDASGAIVARHIAPGCNPNVAGPDAARAVVAEALRTLVASIPGPVIVTHTHIYAAGNRAWWRETGDQLQGFGRVFTADDSHPVVELATDGQPGLALHGGTGSFVAARGPDGRFHYAGGVGWRFGDPGSGYDLGRRAIGRALLELQGWMPASRLGPAVRDYTPAGAAGDAASVTRHFYQHPEPNQQVAGLAPIVLTLAADGEPAARELVTQSIGDLIALAHRVAERLFPGVALAALPAGLSGPILNHPAVRAVMPTLTSLPLQPVTAAPIEGVRRLVLRER